MATSMQSTGRQPIFGVAVPLAKPVKFDRDRMFDAMCSLVGQVGARVRMIEGGKEPGLLAGLRSKSQELKCEIAGVRLTVKFENRRLCDASMMHSFITPSNWSGTLRGMVEHRAHFLVAEDECAGGGSRDARFDRATAVTLAAAAIANLAEAQGAIWLPARNAVPMGTFGSEMERFLDGQAPLQFWLRRQILPPPVRREQELGILSGEELNPGVATIGMTAFIGAEIIAPPSSCDRDVMLDHVFALASAVIDENTELKDGAVFGKAGGIMVRLNWRESGQYSKRPYWELLPRPAPAEYSPAQDGPQPAAPDGGDGPETRLRLVTQGR